jgi:hypothetical protein
LRKSRRGLWYCRRHIPAFRFRKVSNFAELAGPSVDEKPARPLAQDSGASWFTRPCLYGSFIRYSLPVFPGAFAASSFVSFLLLFLTSSFPAAPWI